MPMRLLRIIALLVAAAGILLALSPGLLGTPIPLDDPFAATEARIPGGGLIGLGAFLFFWRLGRHRLITAVNFICCLTVAILAVRLLGLTLDGWESNRQWMWVGVETCIAMVAGWFLWTKRPVR